MVTVRDENRVLDGVLRHVLVGPAVRGMTRLRAEGREHVPPEGPAIIASNHRSFVDSLVIPLASHRRVHFLGKAEYFEGTGVRGWLTATWFRTVGTIPVARTDARAAAESLRIAGEVLAAGGAFGIYPEGTRSRDGRLHRGRTGVARLALASGAPIIPCAVIGTEKVQPPGSNRMRPGRVTVRFGPALDLAPLQAEHSKSALLRAITDEVMDRIGAMSGQERSGRYASDVNAELESRAPAE